MVKSIQRLQTWRCDRCGITVTLDEEDRPPPNWTTIGIGPLLGEAESTRDLCQPCMDSVNRVLMVSGENARIQNLALGAIEDAFSVKEGRMALHSLFRWVHEETRKANADLIRQ